MKPSRLLLVAGLVFACRNSTGGGGLPGDDAGADSTAPMDTGMPPADTGTPPVDTGTPMDTGTPPVDSSPSDRIVPLDTRGCVRMGSENNAAACADGLDNDCDGFADCNDLNCSCQGTCPPGRRAPPGCMCSGPESENCSDGRDNDCNGFVDSMDFACQPRDAGTDAARDAPVRRDTVGCDSGGAMENSPSACSDGLDNDCDGFVDCDDRNCSCVGSCGPADNAPPGCICRGAEGASNATCSDRIDNDCNTFVDCADFACSRNPSITVCPRDGGSGG